MKSNAMQSDTQTGAESRGSIVHRQATYQKVFDARKRPIRGLWRRNDRFYARISVEDPTNGRKEVRRVPLEAAQTVAQAQAEMRRLLTKRDENALPVLKLTPKFSDYVNGYLGYFEIVKDAKRPRTLQTERGHLRAWVEHLGDTRLDKINRAMINNFIAKRQGQGRSGRTVNLGVVVLRNVLKRAIDDGWIQRLPTENLRPLKWTPRKRELFNEGQLEGICDAAIANSKNGIEFADYIRLLAYCGGRMSESLRLKWSDVDWNQRQLTIGADGLAKNHKSRVVDFNQSLEAHLKEMASRKAPDSEWLFPSPQRGNTDRAAKTFRETLLIARAAAEAPKFGFHDCRHFFISMCVMSGIDFMTIAKWVGHQDGGVLSMSTTKHSHSTLK
jgi:integrase